MTSDLLETYLQDHHAGSVVGVELAKRLADSASDWAHADEVVRLRDEIAADQQTLETIMDHLGVSSSKVKDGLGWTAEKLGRLKLNGRLISESPLSRVVELEGLVVGVTGKAALWEALQTAVGDTVAGADLNELAASAEAQRARLETLRRVAAAEAFSPGFPTGRIAAHYELDTHRGYSGGTMEADAGETGHHDHAMPDSGAALTGVAVSATLHCLTGCAIGEVTGMALGTALGFSDVATVALAVTLAFAFGYTLTSIPLLRAGFALSAVIPIALASDTFSIATMEVVDNLIMIAIPGAMDSGLDSILFWGALAFALAVAFVAAVPVNRWLIARGKGHVAVHETGVHGGPPVKLIGAATAAMALFGSAVLLAEALS